MTHQHTSLRKTILKWSMPLMLLIILMDSTLLNKLAISTLENELDADLYSSIEDIKEYLTRSAVGAKDFSLLENASRILLNDEVDTVLYSLTNNKGELLSGSKDLVFNSRSTLKLKAYSSFTEINHEKFRVVRSTFKLPKTLGAEEINIQVAATLHRRNALANKILIGIVVPQLLLVLMSFFIISISVRKGLAPLEVLNDAVSKRSEVNLTPIDLPNTPDEVFLVVNSVNRLMKQLQGLIAGQNNFIADAAHQLRTPLAGAQAQLELADIETDPEKLQTILSKVHQSLERLLRTVNQLLVLAKSHSESRLMIQMAHLDLNVLAKQVVIDMVPLAIQKQIDLGFEQSSVVAIIEGNSERLGELIYNLLDNAIRYTPNKGKITMSISVKSRAVELSVIDNGPGISEVERDKIFDRFYRITGSGQDGSGLGLAIVKEIAKLHNANIEVVKQSINQGLHVKVSFNIAN